MSTVDNRGATTVTLTIGAEGRVRTAAISGGPTVNYTYNALGERVIRVEGAATAHFTFGLRGRLMAVSDGTGAVQREYIWLGNRPLAVVSSGTLYFLHTDHLLRPQKATDASKAIVWDAQFTPFGRTQSITGSLSLPLRFPGQWADAATGYSYNYLRSYDPTLGRYLSTDPLGPAGDRNRYAYAEDNPLNFVDPNGTFRASLWSLAARLAPGLVGFDLDIFGPLSAGLNKITARIKGCRYEGYDADQVFRDYAWGTVLGILPLGKLAKTGRLAIRQAARGGILKQFLRSQSGTLRFGSRNLSISRYRRIVASLESWLGPNLQITRTTKGNLQLISADKLRVVRLDILGYPKPHINVQMFRPGRRPGRNIPVFNKHIDLE